MYDVALAQILHRPSSLPLEQSERSIIVKMMTSKSQPSADGGEKRTSQLLCALLWILFRDAPRCVVEPFESAVTDGQTVLPVGAAFALEGARSVFVSFVRFRRFQFHLHLQGSHLKFHRRQARLQSRQHWSERLNS